MKKRNPEQISQFLEEHMSGMDYPYAFYGEEPNTVTMEDKPWDDMNLKVNMFAAWSSEGIPGNQSIPLVCKLINETDDDVFCDRSYFPCTQKDLNAFTRNGVPIFGLNSRRPLGDFDIIGTSLGFPLFYPNVVKQLKMAGIPVRWKDRVDMDEDYPIILAGGHIYGSPEVWSPIVDLVFVGEAEDEENNPGIQAMMRFIRDYKKGTSVNYHTKTARNSLLRQLCEKFDFLYCPRFHKPIYDDKTKYVTGFDYDGLKQPKRRYVHNFNNVTALTDPPLAYIDPSMGAGEVEQSRGCVGSCSFCSVGFRYRPYRERTVDNMIDILKENYKNTGAVVAFPCAYDFSGYKQKKLLVKRLLEEVSSFVDTQSGRVDNLASDENFVKLASVGGMKQLVWAVEGVSQRLRDMFNKHCNNEDILKCCEYAMKYGFRRIKMYFICDAMYENDDDDKCLIDLMQRIADMRNSFGLKTEVKVSFTPMRIEANTPIQWEKTMTYKKQIGGIPDALRAMGLNVMYGSKVKKERTHFVQIFHLADRIAADALVETCEEMDLVTFGSSARKGFADTMERNLKKRGVDYSHYFCKKSQDFVFPWDIVDIGVSKDYLLNYFNTYRKFITDNPDASKYEKEMEGEEAKQLISKCKSHKICGCCDGDDLKLQSKQENLIDPDIDINSLKIIDDKSIAEKVLLKVYIPESRRFVPNEHWEFQIRRACYLVGLPVSKHSIRFKSSVVKWRNWTFGTDYVELAFTQKNCTDGLIDRLNEYLIKIQAVGFMLVSVDFKVSRAAKKCPVYYTMRLSHTEAEAERVLDGYRKNDYIEMILKVDKFRQGIVREKVNLKDYCLDLWLTKEKSSLNLNMLLSGQASPYDIYCALFNKRMGAGLKCPTSVVDVFQDIGNNQQDFFSGTCIKCGNSIPRNLLNEVFDEDVCPYCVLK